MHRSQFILFDINCQLKLIIYMALSTTYQETTTLFQFQVSKNLIVGLGLQGDPLELIFFFCLLLRLYACLKPLATHILKNVFDLVSSSNNDLNISETLPGRHILYWNSLEKKHQILQRLNPNYSSAMPQYQLTFPIHCKSN